MSDFQLTTPVAFLIFNRPDTTKRVFEEIRRAKPLRLLVVADGPRADHPSDAEKCAAARAIIDQVDWDCQVLTNYSDVNLGCKIRVSSGLDWVFDTVEEAIVLEDDCLPHPTFFRFCEELLEKYRDDERVMLICGDNFQFGRKRTEYSYYFSRHIHIWGWASWRRAWQHYDGDMKLWPEIRDGEWLRDVWLGDSEAVTCWRRIFDAVYRGKIDSWGYIWVFSCWVQSGLSVLPNVNLISNIGFRPDATHTKGEIRLANMATEEMKFPLVHPRFVIPDTRADKITLKLRFGLHQSFLRRLIGRTKRLAFALDRKYTSGFLKKHLKAVKRLIKKLGS